MGGDIYTVLTPKEPNGKKSDFYKKLGYLFLVFLIVLALFVFTGCSVKEQVVVKDKDLVVITPPDELMSDIKTPELNISNTDYILAMPKEREEILTNYIIDLLATIKEYKSKLKKLREWVANARDANKNIHDQDK